ncbi:unannotated protein [freshwater metagenome]|uniref:Unannotated protein n=1 Tax=freshwater metagenome TaxID=449393 RepID=A0A6J7SCK2_9ZZZZ
MGMTTEIKRSEIATSEFGSVSEPSSGDIDTTSVRAREKEGQRSATKPNGSAMRGTLPRGSDA